MSNRSLRAAAPRMKLDTTAKHTAHLRALQQQAAQLSAVVEQLMTDNNKQKVLAFAVLHQDTILKIYQRLDEASHCCSTSVDAGGCLLETSREMLPEFPLLRVLGDLRLHEWTFVGSMSMAEFGDTWSGYMQELALLLHCRERCPAGDTDARILGCVAQCLHLGRAVSLLNPAIIGRLVDLNLLTGEHQPPSASYWQEAVEAISFTKLQLLQLQELMRITGPKLAALEQQRQQLISRFMAERAASTAASTAQPPPPAAAAACGAAACGSAAAAAHPTSQQQQQELLLPLLLSASEDDNPSTNSAAAAACGAAACGSAAAAAHPTSSQQQQQELLLPLLMSASEDDNPSTNSAASGAKPAETLSLRTPQAAAQAGAARAAASTGTAVQLLHSISSSISTDEAVVQLGAAAAALPIPPAPAPAARAAASAEDAIDPALAGLLQAVAAGQPGVNSYNSWQDLPWLTRDMVNEMDQIMCRWRVLAKLSGSAAYLLQPTQMARLMLQCYPYYPVPVQVIDAVIKAASLPPDQQPEHSCPE